MLDKVAESRAKAGGDEIGGVAEQNCGPCWRIRRLSP